MKKLFVCMVVLAAVFAVASGADAQVKFRGFTALTGGGTGALDKIPVAELTDGDIGFVATTDYFYVYKFDSDATDAESTPEAGYQYIRPDDYATAGVWMQIGLYGVAMQSGPSTSPGISFYDSDATDGDINAKFYVNCTDAGSGSEDCDFYIQVQIAGTLTTIIQIDADGNVTYTHPVLMSGDAKLYFRDSAIYLYSAADGYLDIDADTGIRFNGPVLFANEGALALPTTTSGDQTLSAGQIGIKTDEDAIAVHGGAAGEVQDEALISLLNHVVIIFDPAWAYDQSATYRTLPIMYLGDDTPHGITMTEWRLRYVSGDPTTELDADLMCDTTPDFNPAANATVMDALDTTAGASGADSGFDSATCANASNLYVRFGADPTDANVIVVLDIWYFSNED